MDHEHRAIVAARATNLALEKQKAVAMVEEDIGKMGAVPMEVFADVGCYSPRRWRDFTLW